LNGIYLDATDDGIVAEANYRVKLLFCGGALISSPSFSGKLNYQEGYSGNEQKIYITRMMQQKLQKEPNKNKSTADDP